MNINFIQIIFLGSGVAIIETCEPNISLGPINLITWIEVCFTQLRLNLLSLYE